MPPAEKDPPRHDAAQINLIDPACVEMLATALAAVRQGTPPESSQVESVAFLDAAAQVDYSRQYPVVDGTAFIPIRGVLLNGFHGQWGSMVTGYQWVQKAYLSAMADRVVERVAFLVDSPGGQATGCAELAAVIRSMRDVKPTFALVEGMMASAAYLLGSAAATIVATPTAEIGSIGTVLTHFSYQGALETNGIEVTHIYRGAHKIDGVPQKALSEQARQRFDDKAGAHYDILVSAIGEGRGSKLTADAARETEAALFLGAEALERGLVDMLVPSSTGFAAIVAPPDEAKGRPKFMSETNAGEDTTAAAASAAAASAAIAAERARIAAIMALPQAAGQPALAQHFAFNTALSVAEVTAAMAAVVVPEAAAPAAAKTDPLAEAMAKSGNPDPGADAGQAPALSRAQRTLALRHPLKEA